MAGSKCTTGKLTLVAVLAAGLATGFAAGFASASFFASFKGPEGPKARRVSELSQHSDDSDILLNTHAEAMCSDSVAYGVQKSPCAHKRGGAKLTLGLGELALLNTGLDGLVELGVESALGREGDLVVRRYILLDSLATV